MASSNNSYRIRWKKKYYKFANKTVGTSHAISRVILSNIQFKSYMIVFIYGICFSQIKLIFLEFSSSYFTIGLFLFKS